MCVCSDNKCAIGSYASHAILSKVSRQRKINFTQDTLGHTVVPSTEQIAVVSLSLFLLFSLTCLGEWR